MWMTRSSQTILSGVYPDIQFTFEEKKSRELPFLESMKNEEITLCNVLRANYFMKRYTQQTTSRQQPQFLQNGKKPKWRSIPNIKTVSGANARLLDPHGIQVVHKPTSRVHSQLMKPKPPLKASEKSAVAYKNKYKNCPANYI